MSSPVNIIIDCGTSSLKILSLKTKKVSRVTIDIDYDSEKGWCESVVKALKKANAKGTARLILPDFILYSQILDISKEDISFQVGQLAERVKGLLPCDASEVIWDYKIIKDTVEKVKVQWGFVNRRILNEFCRQLMDLSIFPVSAASALFYEYAFFKDSNDSVVINTGYRSSHLLFVTPRATFSKVFYKTDLDKIDNSIKEFEQDYGIEEVERICIDEQADDSILLEGVSALVSSNALNFISEKVKDKVKKRIRIPFWLLSSVAVLILSLIFFVYTKSVYDLYAAKKNELRREVAHLEKSNQAIVNLLNALLESDEKYKSLLVDLGRSSEWIDLLSALESSINETEYAWIDTLEQVSENSVKIKGSLFIDHPQLTPYETDRKNYALFDRMKVNINALSLISEVTEIQLIPSDEHLLNYECTLILNKVL